VKGLHPHQEHHAHTVNEQRPQQQDHAQLKKLNATSNSKECAQYAEDQEQMIKQVQDWMEQDPALKYSIPVKNMQQHKNTRNTVVWLVANLWTLIMGFTQGQGQPRARQ
jgi:hypothetical protein